MGNAAGAFLQTFFRNFRAQLPEERCRNPPASAMLFLATSKLLLTHVWSRTPNASIGDALQAPRHNGLRRARSASKMPEGFTRLLDEDLGRSCKPAGVTTATHVAIIVTPLICCTKDSVWALSEVRFFLVRRPSHFGRKLSGEMLEADMVRKCSIRFCHKTRKLLEATQGHQRCGGTCPQR